MAFVNERGENGKPKFITIDRDRNIILAYIGSGPDEPTCFEFIKDRKTIKIYANPRVKLQNKDRFIVWEIKKIFPDISFDKDVTNTQKDIASALICFGEFGAAELHPEQIKQTTVEFDL